MTLPIIDASLADGVRSAVRAADIDVASTAGGAFVTPAVHLPFVPTGR